ncbi:MAG: hypothetical protein C3F13_04090 [Anaerolineales bacterium]|nr:MAG: hypothetical protein C3F13_04090 [Anaerolineales bacterium]
MTNKKRNPFKLKDFHSVDPKHIARLEAVGVKTADQILKAGRTSPGRSDLAARAGIPPEAILELVKLSDLSRLPGVKGIRARLYYAAGVDTVEKLAGYEPDELLRLTSEYVHCTGFPGIAPLPKEVSSTILNARNLPKLVEW